MAVVYADRQSTFQLQAGEILTVSGSASGWVVPLDVYRNPTTPIPYAGTTVSYGPFIEQRLYTIVCYSGELNVTKGSNTVAANVVSVAAVRAAIASKGFTDGVTRMGVTSTLVAEMQLLGLTVEPAPTPTPTPGPTPTPTPTPVPSIAISVPISKNEGNSGTTAFDYTVTLNRDGSTLAYPFTWTVTGTGSNPASTSDFVGGVFPSGSGTFTSTQTSKTISVSVAGDTTVEPNEQFIITVTVPGIGVLTSTGTIINEDTPPVSGLDPNYPVPKMKIPVGTAGTYPPAFDVDIPADAQADNVKYRIERYTLVNPSVIAQTYTATITNAQATANAISGLFTSVTDACTYRMRLESLDGTTYGNWSDTVLHGDTTAPIIATATTGSIKENTKLAVPLLVSNEPAGVDWAIIGGADAAYFDIVNANLRWKDDGVADFESTTHGNTYVVTYEATDKAGNKSTSTRTQTVTDVDEIPDDFTFEDEPNAAKSTAYTRTFTVSGIETGYSVPITAESGLSYKIGSGSYTTAAGTVTNGDVVTVRMTSSSADATKVTGYLVVGSARRGFGVQTSIGNAAAISSVDYMSNTGFGTDVSFPLNMTAGVVLLMIQRNGTQNDISNVTIGGVVATRLSGAAADPGWLYVAVVSTAGAKTVAFTGPTGADYSAVAVCVANTQVTGATATSLKTNYYNYRITVPSVTIPTNGIGVSIITTERKATDQTPSSNLKLDRIITPPTGDKIIVGALLASGAVTFGEENGYYTAYNVALAHA